MLSATAQKIMKITKVVNDPKEICIEKTWFFFCFLFFVFVFVSFFTPISHCIIYIRDGLNPEHGN